MVNLKPTAVRTIENGEISVHVRFEGVDRPISSGWLVGPATPAKARLSERLCHAINAGVITRDSTVKTDVNGNTYVNYSSAILGRHMNADLKRLGF